MSSVSSEGLKRAKKTADKYVTRSGGTPPPEARDQNTTAERRNRQAETVHQSIERQAQGLCCIAAYFYVAPLCRLWLTDDSFF
jgi:hypothetical protein